MQLAMEKELEKIQKAIEGMLLLPFVALKRPFGGNASRSSPALEDLKQFLKAADVGNLADTADSLLSWGTVDTWTLSQPSFFMHQVSRAIYAQDLQPG